jgi:DNA-binding transcriptional LysR family regulator
MLGSGVSLVPRRVLRTEVAEGRIIAVPLAPPGLFRPVGIIHRKKKRFHRAAKALLELMRESPDREPAFSA